MVATGCGSQSNEKKADVSEVNAPVKSIENAPINTIEQQQVTKTPTGPSVPVSTSTPVSAPKITTPVTISSKPTVTTNTAGLNPAHGQPGHRCDISVGAPLNSKPAQQPTVVQQPAIVQQPAVTTTPQKTYVSEAQKLTPPTITTPPTVVAEGMNPEHGKPGHRCDIAVGAPLNSKPKQ